MYASNFDNFDEMDKFLKRINPLNLLMDQLNSAISLNFVVWKLPNNFPDHFFTVVLKIYPGQFNVHSDFKIPTLGSTSRGGGSYWWAMRWLWGLIKNSGASGLFH